MNSWKRAFSMSVGLPSAPLHFAAHSHHPWPDISHAAHERAWRDAATLLDRKWDKVFGEVIPAAQGHVARHLNLPSPHTVTFAPNTHEFLIRILSCFPQTKRSRVLSTDSEFHTFTRQMGRLQEEDLVELTTIPAQPYATFAERFGNACASGQYDLIFLSNVFFNSGFWVQDLAALVEAIRDTGTLIVIDGYHSFMAVPLDLHAIAGRVFYMSGGYKYAMAGEGCAFLHAPEGYGPRPRNTGWFAEFAELAVHRAGTVGYASDAMRFMGATFEPSGLYRFNAVMDWLEGEGLTVEVMRAHARALQSQLITLLSRAKHKIRPDQALLHPDDPALARFLTFEMDGAQAIQGALMQDGIVTDARGRRLRIGFGIYQDEDDVGKLCHALKDGL